MRKYYKVDEDEERYVGSVDGTDVAVADESDRRLVSVLEDKLSQAFNDLGSNNLNASMAFGLYLGGAMLVLDTSNISADVAQFVYWHELGHIRLGHHTPSREHDVLTRELAADEYAAAKVSLSALTATIEWLRSMAVIFESNPVIHGFDLNSASQHQRIRAQALEKRLQA